MKLADYASKASQSFTLPEVCIRIRDMLDDKYSSIDDIAELVTLDPSLASKLLKLANSPLFRFRSEVDSISKAVNIIGGEALYNLVMAETASNAFRHFTPKELDTRRFWMQSIYTGLIAKHLAKMQRMRGSERFFLLGLLHNLGELVVASRTPEKAAKCSEYNQQILPWELQTKVLGFTYSQCSAEIMKLWKLPVQIYLPVSEVHERSKAMSSKELAILYVAIRAAAVLESDGLYTQADLLDEHMIDKACDESEFLQESISFSKLEANKLFTIMRV